MKSLASVDFSLLNKIIEDLYNPKRTLPARLVGFLNTLPRLVYYDRAAILFFYRKNDGTYVRHSSFNTNWEHTEVPVQSYYDYYYKLDDTLPIFDQPTPILFRASDFFNHELRKETEYWKNYLEPNNCIFSLEGNLSLKNSQGLMGGFCFFRGSARNDFSERDKLLMAYLQPHLSNVLKYYGNTVDSTSITFLLENHNCIGTVMLDENYDITRSNLTFRKMIADQDSGQTLVSKVRTLSIRLANSDKQSIEYKFDDKPILIEVSKVSSGIYAEPYRYCCLVYDLSYFFNTSLDQARKKYSLTDKEYKIIQETLNGKSNEEIASQFYISIPTVKKHLASIYSKMEIKNQKQIFEKLNIK